MYAYTLTYVTTIKEEFERKKWCLGEVGEWKGKDVNDAVILYSQK